MTEVRERAAVGRGLYLAFVCILIIKNHYIIINIQSLHSTTGHILQKRWHGFKKTVRTDFILTV